MALSSIYTHVVTYLEAEGCVEGDKVVWAPMRRERDVLWQRVQPERGK